MRFEMSLHHKLFSNLQIKLPTITAPAYMMSLQIADRKNPNDRLPGHVLRTWGYFDVSARTLDICTFQLSNDSEL